MGGPTTETLMKVLLIDDRQNEVVIFYLSNLSSPSTTSECFIDSLSVLSLCVFCKPANILVQQIPVQQPLAGIVNLFWVQVLRIDQQVALLYFFLL